MSFDMHDSGTREQFDTGAVRDASTGKPNPALISPFFLTVLAGWLTKGASKYSDRNWEQGFPISRIVASLFRHLIAYMLGLQDEDHLAGMACNIMFLVHHREAIKRGLLPQELDDMPHYLTDKPEKAAEITQLADEVAAAVACDPPGQLVTCGRCSNTVKKEDAIQTAKRAWCCNSCEKFMNAFEMPIGSLAEPPAFARAQPPDPEVPLLSAILDPELVPTDAERSLLLRFPSIVIGFGEAASVKNPKARALAEAAYFKILAAARSNTVVDPIPQAKEELIACRDWTRDNRRTYPVIYGPHMIELENSLIDHMQATGDIEGYQRLRPRRKKDGSVLRVVIKCTGHTKDMKPRKDHRWVDGICTACGIRKTEAQQRVFPVEEEEEGGLPTPAREERLVAAAASPAYGASL